MDEQKQRIAKWEAEEALDKAKHMNEIQNGLPSWYVTRHWNDLSEEEKKQYRAKQMEHIDKQCKSNVRVICVIGAIALIVLGFMLATGHLNILVMSH